MQTLAAEILKYREVKENLYKNIFLAEHGISLEKYAEVKNFPNLFEMLTQIKKDISDNNDSIGASRTFDGSGSGIILMKYEPVAILTEWDGLLKTDNRLDQGIVDREEIFKFLDNPMPFLVRPRKFIRVITRSSVLHYSDYGHLKHNLYDEGDSLIKDVWYNCLIPNTNPANCCEIDLTDVNAEIYTFQGCDEDFPSLTNLIHDGGDPELRSPEAIRFIDD